MVRAPLDSPALEIHEVREQNSLLMIAQSKSLSNVVCKGPVAVLTNLGERYQKPCFVVYSRRHTEKGARASRDTKRSLTQKKTRRAVCKCSVV